MNSPFSHQEWKADFFKGVLLTYVTILISTSQLFQGFELELLLPEMDLFPTYSMFEDFKWFVKIGILSVLAPKVTL